MKCETERQRRKHRKAAPKRRGPKRSGATHTTAQGYVVVYPIEETERAFPTSQKSGAIRRSHLVWNKAHPEDVVQRGEHVHHINRDKGDDRIQNLRKLTASEHAREHAAESSSRLKAGVDKTCQECGAAFRGAYGSKFCSDEHARASRTRAAREARAAKAPVSSCRHCGDAITGQRRYCAADACQRERVRVKQQRWWQRRSEQ